MANYPLAGNQTGFVYEPDIPMSPNNNAKATGYFTVAQATSTVATNANIKPGDIVILSPKNAKASAMISGATNTEDGIYVSATADGSFTVTHESHATPAGSIFYYAIFRNL